MNYGNEIKTIFYYLPSEKKLSLCLCKLCLNIKMLLEPLMTKVKKDHDTTYESASEFFMAESNCKKSPNSYWKWKCFTLNVVIVET